MPKATTIKPVIFARPNADGRHTVFIRITKQSKPVYMATTITVQFNDFTTKASIDNPVWIDKKHPLAKSYNELIKQKLIEYDMHRHEVKYSSREIKEMLVRPYDRNCIISFWKKIAEEKSNSHGIPTMNKYKAECNKFERFYPGAKWSDVSYTTIKKYELHLLSINNRNTTSKSLEFLKEVLTEYLKRNKVSREENPFKDFKIIKERHVVSNAKKGVLNAREITLLEQLPLLPGTSRFHARNIFLAQIFGMGARIGEMLLVENANIKDNRLMYSLEKKGTNTPFYKSILITPRLQKIIDLYYDANNRFLFPYMEGTETLDLKAKREVKKQLKNTIHNKIKSSTSLINKSLKEVCSLAGVEKMISTHTARHTVGQILEESGVDLVKIQNTFGHETLQETQVYLAIGKPLMVDETVTVLENCLKIA